MPVPSQALHGHSGLPLQVLQDDKEYKVGPSGAEGMLAVWQERQDLMRDPLL